VRHITQLVVTIFPFALLVSGCATKSVPYEVGQTQLTDPTTSRIVSNAEKAFVRFTEKGILELTSVSIAEGRVCGEPRKSNWIICANTERVESVRFIVDEKALTAQSTTEAALAITAFAPVTILAYTYKGVYNATTTDPTIIDARKRLRSMADDGLIEIIHGGD